MSIVFACTTCGSPSITLPEILDDEAVVHCGRCNALVGRWGPFKALARRVESGAPGVPGRAPEAEDQARLVGALASAMG